MIVKTHVLTALQRHMGAANGIGAAALARELDASERDVRHCITELREDGIAVCGHPKTGYFIAATAEELETTCRYLHARAMTSLTLESKLRHVPLPDLLGQMRLKT